MAGRWQRLFDGVEAVSRGAAWVAGALLLGAAAWIGVEVLVRKLLGISTQGSTEISSYVLALSTAWALPYTLLRKAHVRVDVLVARLPLAGRAALHLVALFVLLTFVIPLAYFGWGVAWASFVRRTAANTVLGTPLWIPQGLWMLGLVAFALVLLLMTVRVVGLMARQDYAGVERLAGLGGSAEEPAAKGAKRG
ncbi:MAG: TRAP transporter small permease [Limnochordaceae bacterium]|nr:TRAP transporter small permease [Limnochordaceae bacterium]